MGFKSDLGETIKLVLKVGQIWLKSASGKLSVRNNTDTDNASLVCHELEVSGDAITLNSDASNTGNDRSVRIQKSPNASASYTLTLPSSSGNTGDKVVLTSPGVLSFIADTGSNAATLNAWTADQLRDRSNHTGTQPASSITGLGSAAFFHSSSFVGSNDPRLAIFTSAQAGLVPAPGTGTNRYLREDGTWQNVSGGSGGSGGSGDFINGGNIASSDLNLGSNNNFGLNLETNNLSRLSVAPNGAVNIWDGQNRYAVPSGYMQPGSLTIGSGNRDYGGGSNWNNNTAALLFECNDNTESIIHDANTRLVSLFRYEGNLQHRITWGRDAGWGVLNQHHFVSRSLFITHKTSFNFHNLNYPIDENNRTNAVIAGFYPHLYLISNQSGSNHGNGLSFAEMTQGSSNNARQWHFAQASLGRFFQIGYIESTDFNPHLGIQNHGATTLLSIVAPGHSTNLGNRGGISLNGRFDPEYHLDLNEGSVGWGISNSRTERKNNAGSAGSLDTKQSGFFDADSPQNFYPTASGWQHLIDCRHGNNTSYALQISTGFWNDFNSGLWWRATGGNGSQGWNKILSTNSSGQSNGWLSTGNNNVDSGQHFIGTLNNADLVFKRNNIEAFRIPSQNVIQVNCQSGYGNPSRPHYSFYWNWGEDDGMYLEADGVLCFSVQGTKRFSISAPNNRIEAHGFPFRTDQGYWVNNDRLLREKSTTTINTLSTSASLNDAINTLNTLIQVLKNHHTLFS